MAPTTGVTAIAAPSPNRADVERASEFTREPLLLTGESPEDIALGSARHRAIVDALAELDRGAENPSIEWRRRYSLLLGLERLLSENEPTLTDGATLNPHQVDALSGTLTALTAELESSNGGGETNGNGGAARSGAAATAEVDEEPDEEVGATSVEIDEAEGEVDDDEVDEAAEVDDEADAEAADTEDDEAEDDDEADDEADDEEEPAEEEPAELSEEEEEPLDWEDPEQDEEDEVAETGPDPGASRRFWFEHATGAGKTVAAVGFIDATRTGGVLILTHRRNLVEQFIGEISDRGYKDRLTPPLLDGADHPYGPVTVETYQWFVRNAGRVSDAYSVVICDEAHTALGEKTSACIRSWPGPVFIGMTATGALIARHVADLFPTQTSRFDLAQAARRGVISPLRCIRIPPGPGVRTIAKVPLRRGEVDQDFDQEELAALLDQEPFNLAVADLYRSRFRNMPGVVYTAGVRHANNVAAAFRAAGMNARSVSGETPKRELAETLAAFERGEVDVLCNAMLLAEGWNSPRATICMHLAPTASRRVYQQRVGRVTRRHPAKESGVVIDFVHPATTHDETIVTLHSLLDRDVYRGGAIVVGPVRRGRSRRVKVERRVVPVSGSSERRLEVLERELWRIAVENLNHTEQHAWAALAGARVTTAQWRRAKTMIPQDPQGELRKRFVMTCLQRNRNPQLRLKALAEVPGLRDGEAFDDAIEIVATWPRDERRAGSKLLLQALAERKIGRRDQAQAWVWRLAGLTRELHEEYAVQRWPETKRLLGLFVNSSGRAHGKNARRLVAAARQQDTRLATALLAAAVSHTPEAEEALRGTRMRMARKPSAVARELLRNFPKGRRGRRRRSKLSDEQGQGKGRGAGGSKGSKSTKGSKGSKGRGRGSKGSQGSKPSKGPHRGGAEAGDGSNGGSAAEPDGKARGNGSDGEPAEVDLAGGEGARAAAAKSDD